MDVQVKKGSNLVGVAPTPPAAGADVIAAIAAGILLLEDRPHQPDRFTEAALRGLRSLGRVVGDADADDTRVRIWAHKKPIEVTPRSGGHISELLQGAYEDYGSVEGRLQTVSERGAYRVVVYEPVWDRAISCFLPEALMPEAISAFGQRVEVYGLIHYRSDGTPISIKWNEIVPFPRASIFLIFVVSMAFSARRSGR